MTGLYGKPVEDGHWATPEFKVMRDAVKDQADLIAISDADRTDITWSTDDDMEKAHIAYVSGNMFPLFGLEPVLGRLLAPADDRAPGVAPYAVLSWDYWNHRFGRDPYVLGRSLQEWWKQVLFGSVPLDLLKTAEDVDLHVISFEDQEGRA